MNTTVQSTYDRYMPVGVAGTFAEMSANNNVDTKQAEGTIAFGIVVSKGEADDGVVAAGALYVGVSMRDITIVHDTADRYEEGDNVAVATRGDMWVVAEDAVVAQTAVTYNTTTGALGSSGGTTIVDAYWLTSADAGEMAKVRLLDAVNLTT